MIRKPERRHSVELEVLDEQDKRPYKCVLKKNRPLLPRPKFHSKCPDAKGICFQQVAFILRHIVQQRYQEKQQEDLEREKRESVKRRQAEFPTDIVSRPRRLIPVEPVISPFDSEENKVP